MYMGRFYDILDFTLFEGVNKDGIAEFLKNASNKISSYKKGDIAIFQDSLCKSLSIYGTENRFPVTLQAEDDVIIWSLSKDDFLKMMESDDALLRNFLRQISDRSVFLSRKLNEFALQNLSTRIVSYLQRNGIITNIQNVAFIMGVARPSLSRTLSAMVEEGVLIKTEEGYRLLKS